VSDDSSVVAQGTEVGAEQRELSEAAIEDETQRQQLVSALVSVRVGQGLTQVEVARRMGVTQPTVSAFEKGMDSRVKSYQRYARACGVELRIRIEPNNLDRQAIAEALLDGFQGGRWNKSGWSDLPSKVQQQLLRQADAVIALMARTGPVQDEAS
jgi:transcriptional regulator with XRE-family HTH domain